MAKLSKRVRAFREKVDANHSYPVDEAVALLKEFGTAKFNETVEVAVNLGVDARKSDQGVRGATTLPHGTGSEVRVAVFAQGESADKAKELGADFVGMEELAEQIKGGMMDFDVVIASPDAMRVVGTLGQVLGPRGLMPNPKTGTVTPDIEAAVQNAKAGQMRFRSDKNGIVHGGIGKVSFEPDAIKGNLIAVLSDLKKAKPAAAKGVYVRKVTLSTTMGPGVTIDHNAIDF
jgi:large subunit ribosomal protein L1